MNEIWRPIKYDPRYEVSLLGNFRKKLKNGFKELTPYYAHRRWVVKIKDKELSCARLVADAFVKRLTPEDRVYHKNKINNDNFYANLEVINLSELGKRTGHLAKERPVVEIKNNEIVRWWRSSKKAGKKLFMSYQTVCDYCNHKVDKPMYNLMWEDEYFDKVYGKFRWEVPYRKR